MNGPTFVVAGAARSGTTAVTESLRTHPDVFMTQPKEPHYFAFADQNVNFCGPGDQDNINRLAVTGRDAYLALFPDDGGYAALGEGSVSTLYYHETSVPAIQSVNPDMRIVVVLRDPVERAFSSYQYLRSRGLEPLDDFRSALAQEPRRVQEGWHHLWHYTGMSMYAASVGHFLDAFGGEQVGVWFHDDFVTDGRSVIEEVCAFIGVDPSKLDDAAVQQVNVSGQARSRQFEALIGQLSRSGHARRTVKAVVPFAVRERIRRANLKASPVPADVRRELEGQFREDLVELGRILGRPLPDWS